MPATHLAGNVTDRRCRQPQPALVGDGRKRGAGALLHRQPAVTSALELDAGDRAILLRLAIPGLTHETPFKESLFVREAFGPIRWYLRKFDACSTIDDVLELVENTVTAQFPDASFVRTAFRSRCASIRTDRHQLACS